MEFGVVYSSAWRIVMSTKKKSAANIIKPLAAAFLTPEPEEEVVAAVNPQP